MTVSYNAEVATTKFGTFGRLLFRWKASIYKLLWRELIVFVSLFVSIAAVYRYALSCEMQGQFEKWVAYCKTELRSSIPLTFILGFYVNIIVDRWWKMLQCVAWADRASYHASVCLTSKEKDSPLSMQYRRAVVRYLNLAQLLIWRDVSTAVKTRYPQMDDLVRDGLVTAEEKQILDSVKGDNRLGQHHQYWLIMQWANDVMCRATSHSLVRDVFAFKAMFDEVIQFRDRICSMLCYDWVPVPLAYTQVVTLVVYAYFLSNMFGHQYVFGKEVAVCKNETSLLSDKAAYMVQPYIEMYVPIFPICEFMFYMGLLKVAESIMNPLGQDDDDFESNYIINRNLAISYAVVDTCRSSCPPLKIETEPSLIDSSLKAKPLLGSAVNYKPKEIDQKEKEDAMHDTPGGPPRHADVESGLSPKEVLPPMKSPTELLLSHRVMRSNISSISESKLANELPMKSPKLKPKKTMKVKPKKSAHQAMPKSESNAK